MQHKTRVASVLGALLLPAFLAAGIAGCAADGEQRADVRTDCLSIRLARDFRTLDDRNLIVYAPAGRAYHVELAAGCIVRPRGFQIGLRARGDTLCGFAGDAVVIDGDSCPVARVQRLTDEELEDLLWRFGEGTEVSEGEGVETEIPARDDPEAQ